MQLDLTNLKSKYKSYHQEVWHNPIRAETYAILRIVVAFCLLMDQLVQFLPNLEFFYGPTGFAPVETMETHVLYYWRWQSFIFFTNDMAVIYTCFFLWVGATVSMLVGWKSRISTCLVWFGFMCFYYRNDVIMNSGDRLLFAILFILVLSPVGKALSVDSKKQPADASSSGPVTVPPWGIRVLQWQIALLYLSTGITKLHGHMWWEGTVIHYVLNDVTLAHWSFAYFPLPLFVTKIMTYASVIWECLFLFLVWYKPTRKATLFFGVAFHLGITFLIEVGWFSFYTMTLYLAFLPDSYWQKRDLKKRQKVAQ